MANTLFEVTVLDNGTPKTLRMASAAATAAGCQLNNYPWTPLITKRHSTTGSWADTGILQQGTVNHNSLSFRMSSAYENEVWSSYEWTGGLARIFVQTGDEGDFSTYKQVFEGSVSSLDRDGINATVGLLGPDALLDRNLLSLEYKGTGGAEGPAALKGKLKPRAFGFCQSVEPTLVDAAGWIYQVHGYGAVASIKPYEFAQALDPAKNKGDAADFASLKALTLVPGEWATCLALGMFRIGGTPSQKVSADVSPGGASTVATILTQLLTLAGIPAAKQGSFAPFSSAVWNLYATEQATVGEVARSAVYQAGGMLFADGTGKWQVMDYFAPSTAIVLNADRSTAPLVNTVRELTAAPPVWKVRVGYDRCWSVHSTSDVSPALSDASDAAVANADAARAASEAARLAQADATIAKQRLDAIASDGVLSRDEKADLVQRFGIATAERPGILAKGSDYNISTERSNYDSAYTALKTYLEGLSPAYTDSGQDTNINRTDFDTAWKNYHLARQNLLNAIDGKAGTLATWGGVTGTGKPADNATVGAPVGTNVGGVEASTLVSTANTANSNASTALNAVKDKNGVVTGIQTVIDSVAAEVTRAKQEVADTRTSLNTDIAAAKQEGTTARNDLAAAKTSLGTDIAAAKQEGTAARSEAAAAAKSASDEVTRAKAAEGSITTSVTNLKSTVDGHTTTISDNYTTLTNKDTALANRATALEASVNGANGSKSLDAKIADEATVRANADSALASRTTVIESTASTGAGILNVNPNFSLWNDGLAAPNGWAIWGGDGSAARIPSGSPTGGYAVRMNGNSTGNYGLAQMDGSGPIFTNGWYTLEADVELHSGSWLGAGLTIQGHANLDFARDTDTYGAGANSTFIGRRKFSKVIRLEVATDRNWHAMVNWEGLGAAAKSMTWYRVAVRPATQGEIDGRQGRIDATSALSRITTEETTRVGADSALATRATNLESTVNTGPDRNGALRASISDEATTRSNSDSALATRTTAVEARTLGGGNLITNTDFVSSTPGVVADGWNAGSATAVAPTFAVNIAGDSWRLPNENAISIYQSGQAGASGYTLWNSNRFAVAAGAYLQAYCFMASHRCLTELIIYWFDSSGNTVSASVSGAQGGTGAEMNGGQNLASWRQQGITSVIVPSSVVSASLELRKYNTNSGQGDSYAWFTRPYAGAARSNTTEYTPFSPGSAKASLSGTAARIGTEETTRANAVSALATRATNLEATVNTGPDRNGALRASISDEATTRSNADTAIANRATSLESQVAGTAASGLQTLIKTNRKNLIDVSWWKKGASIPWGLNGGQQNVIYTLPDGANGNIKAPDGSSGDVWLAQADNGGQAAGGWNGGPIAPLDPDKTYRFIVPIAQIGAGNRTAYWGTDGVCALNTTTGQGNPYFAVGSLPLNNWYLFVGFIYPRNSTGKTNDGAGIWDMSTGVKISDGINYCFYPDGRQPIHRAYQYYASNNAYQAFGRPLVELVDGTETPFMASFDANRAAFNANARIGTEETTRANADSALAGRATTLETSVNNGATGNLALRGQITDEATTRSNNDSALATRASNLEASATNSGNLVPNTSFNTLDGWSLTYSAKGGTINRNAAGAAWQIGGVENNLSLTQGPAGDGYMIEAQSAAFAVKPGEYYQVQALTASHRCNSWVSLFFYDGGNNMLAYAGENFGPRINVGGQSISAHDIAGNKSAQAPGGTVYARMVLRIYNVSNDGYGWFHRPYVGVVKSNTNQWNSYSPGDDRPIVASTLARIGAEETARANGDSALTTKTDTMITEYRGNNTNLNTRIFNEETARANADSAMATRTSGIEATYNMANGGVASNDRFANWPDGSKNPRGWTDWVTEGNYTISRSPGFGGSPYAAYTQHDANASCGFCQNAVSTWAGKWVVEVTARRDAGSLSGAGVTLSGIYNLDFVSDPDTNGQARDSNDGETRTWVKMFDITQANLNLHAMAGWLGFGRSIASNYITWFKLSLRPAGPGDLAGVKNASDIATANVRIGNEETARSNADSALGSRTQTLESNYTTVRSNLDNWNGDRYQDYLRFNSRVAAEESTRSSAVSALANRTSVVEAQVSSDAGNMLRNGIFNAPNWVGRGGGGVPPQWAPWVQDGNAFIGASPRDSRYGAPAPLQIDRNGINNGITQGVNNVGPGWYVFEVDVTGEDGNWSGSGLHCNFNNGTAFNYGFAMNADSAGRLGDIGTANRQFSWLVYNPANSGTASVYLMAGWSGFQGGTNFGFVRTVWHRVVMRPASDAEIQARKVADSNLIARVSTTESAVSSLNGRTAAYWQVQAVAGNNRAQMTVRADANGGAGVDIVGDVNFSGNLNVGPDSGGNRMKLTNSGLWLYDANGTLRAQLSL